MCGFWCLQSPAQNPILKNITDYLIEEVSAEEEELLGSGSGMDPEETAKEGHPAETTVERDEKLAKVCCFQSTDSVQSSIHSVHRVFCLFFFVPEKMRN